MWTDQKCRPMFWRKQTLVLLSGSELETSIAGFPTQLTAKNKNTDEKKKKHPQKVVLSFQHTGHLLTSLVPQLLLSQSPLRQYHISTWERANEAKDIFKWSKIPVLSFAFSALGFLMGTAVLSQKVVVIPLPHPCPTMTGLSLLSMSVELQRSGWKSLS